MKDQYSVEIDLSLNDNAKLNVIRLAREVYVKRGVARFAHRPKQVISPGRFIPGLEHALIELAEANSMFEEAGIRNRSGRLAAVDARTTVVKGKERTTLLDVRFSRAECMTFSRSSARAFARAG